MADQQSPLSEAKPESLAELFARDPLELTRQDRDTIISVLRSARVEFEKADAQPKPKKRSALEKVETLDLKDLGL